MIGEGRRFDPVTAWNGHPTICQTAAQIAPVLTKEMMGTPTISLAMMSLMQTLAKDDSPERESPRVALMKCLEGLASKAWLAVLRGSAREKWPSSVLQQIDGCEILYL